VALDTHCHKWGKTPWVGVARNEEYKNKIIIKGVNIQKSTSYMFQGCLLDLHKSENKESKMLHWSWCCWMWNTRWGSLKQLQRQAWHQKFLCLADFSGSQMHSHDQDSSDTFRSHIIMLIFKFCIYPESECENAQINFCSKVSHLCSTSSCQTFCDSQL